MDSPSLKSLADSVSRPATVSSDLPSAAASRDCLACRVTGSVTFAGVAVYLLYERARVPLVGGARGHRALLLAGAGAFVVASVARWRM